ncbi:hypothetical protein EJ06DRAFT_533148 [Trichodelitschia bisporula]|uniref:Endoplasmic reticulum lectin n=1 Tax=Trichodelitschia bisporula TaxID=703511 RepID=A0A6G1HP68_9PEZI|nr:hypothetical protein EJ06DRAFT_533148 [Trichodelitschia bisporula]
MRHLWALPVLLPFAIASPHQFSVQDDLVAFPQYEVLISDNPVTEDFADSVLGARSQSATDLDPSDGTSAVRGQDIAGYESMILSGQEYLCMLPRIPVDESRNVSKKSVEDENKELARATKRGWELLRGMEGNCLYFYSGWWSYSFCYNQGVRQFHQLTPGRNVPVYPPVEDKSVDSYILGSFQKSNSDSKDLSNEKGVARMETKGETRYLVQKLSGGTVCDLTGKERKIEVQFHCQPNFADRITLIKETTTCQYLMVISTPRLCNDIAFLPPQESKPHSIACSPVMDADSIPSFNAAREQHLADEDTATAEIEVLMDGLEVKTKTLVIGDIKIGGHQMVPRGKKIEQSAIVKSGFKETLIATIAKSDGYVASDKELEKLNIRNSKEIRDVKEEVERLANGKGWKLEVVDTPRGRELRGIVDEKEPTVLKDDPLKEGTKEEL